MCLPYLAGGESSVSTQGEGINIERAQSGHTDYANCTYLPLRFLEIKGEVQVSRPGVRPLTP